MKEFFKDKKFRRDTLIIIEHANSIINEYAAQGYSLTLRQLYYQFVARDLIPNTERSYKRLGNIISDARLAGYLDWEAIEDRTRYLRHNSHWDDAAAGIRAVRDQFRIDLWDTQPTRVEVWIEKEALIGVIADTCERWDVPYFACKGYVSQSESWRAYRRSLDQPLIILHLGDHDPSGIDMTRDNEERLCDVFGGDVQLQRLALNMDQVRQHNPPPNPAKMTDSRFRDYVRRYGDKSWELDALEPKVLNELIEQHIQYHIDERGWNDAIELQDHYRSELNEALAFIEARQ